MSNGYNIKVDYLIGIYWSAYLKKKIGTYIKKLCKVFFLEKEIKKNKIKNREIENKILLIHSGIME